MSLRANGDVRVLVVEDDEALAEYYADRLEDFDVTVTHTFEQARDSIDDTYSVALLDRQLPDGKGDTLVDIIRRRNLDCRIAMISGVKPGFDIISMGFDEYLCKPVPEGKLRATVTRLAAQSTYSTLLTRLYTTVSKKALLEAHYTEEELEDNDAYLRLSRRVEALENDLYSETATFRPRQFTSELARCERTFSE